MDSDKSLVNSSKAIAQKLSSALNDANLDSGQEFIDNITLLEALLLIKNYVTDVEKNLIEAAIGVKVLKEDENGWPAFQVVIDFEDSQIGKLSVGAETRRNGPIIYIKNSFSDLVIELKKSQYSKSDELVRVLKRTFRSFTDEIESSYIYSKTKILEEIAEEAELSETLFESAAEPAKEETKFVERCSAGIGSVAVEQEEKDSIDSLDDLDFSI